MSRSHRRLSTLASVAALVLVAGLVGISPAAAATAAPVATFVTPIPGLTTVIQTGSFGASWTIAKGVSVSSTTVVVQTSRPLRRGRL